MTRLSRALQISSCHIRRDRSDGAKVVSGFRVKLAGVSGGVACECELDGMRRYFRSRGEG